TAEGRVAAYADLANKVAALVELRCETPSVVKNDLFVALGNDVARQVAEKNPANVEALMKQPLVSDPGRTVQQRFEDVVGRIRENRRVSRFLRVAGLAGTYVHHDGTLGVLVEVEGEGRADAELLKDIAAHIAALPPAYLRREDIPRDILAR